MLTVSIIITVIFGQTPLKYTEVVKIDSVLSNELYNRASLWFATAYNSANDVLQMDDKDQGQIIGKANIIYKPKIFNGSEQTKGNIKYTIKIFVKDERYKYEISNFIHVPYGNSSFGLITTDVEYPDPKPLAKKWSNKVWRDIKNQIEENISSLIASLKHDMSKQAETEVDDW